MLRTAVPDLIPKNILFSPPKIHGRCPCASASFAFHKDFSFCQTFWKPLILFVLCTSIILFFCSFYLRQTPKYINKWVVRSISLRNPGHLKKKGFSEHLCYSLFVSLFSLTLAEVKMESVYISFIIKYEGVGLLCSKSENTSDPSACGALPFSQGQGSDGYNVL